MEEPRLHLPTSPAPKPPILRRRFWLAGAMLGVMVAGLLWRSRFNPLPAFAFKYGGDALWAWLVFLGWGFLFPRATTARLALLAGCFATAVEFSQLLDTPCLNAVRATRIGALVLGSTFHPPDLLAYAAGIALAVCVDLRWLRAPHPGAAGAG